MTPPNGLPPIRAVLIVLVAAAALRIANFPHLHELRDEDEVRYATAGLQLLEGIPPGMKTTPNGPQTWLAAGYGATVWAKNLIHSPPEWAGIPSQVKFFLAADKTLFDIYGDVGPLRRFLLWWQTLVSLLAVYLAFRFGNECAGLAGGILLGGVGGCLPIFVHFAAMSRSYSDAWSFAWIAVGLFAWPNSRAAAAGRAIAYGLAVGSRIEMLGLAPAMVLLQFRACGWTRECWWRVLRLALGSAAVTYMSAPWLLTHFIGLVRMAVTVRFAGQFTSPSPRRETAVDLLWLQGLGPLLAALVLGLPFVIRRLSWAERGLVVFALLLVLSMFTGAFQPMRYHGAALISVLVVGAFVVGGLGWDRRLAAAVAVVLVALPFCQSVRWIRYLAANRVDADVVAWIESNIPAGSTIYFFPGYEAAVPLPTPEASKRIWDEVTDPNAYQRKFQRGLERFRLQTPWLPRAFSEENLWLERADVRRWFILGSGVDRTRPRYDLRLDIGSPVFGERDVLNAARQTGGVVLLRGDRPNTEPGAIRQEWLAEDGTGVFIVDVKKND